MARTTASSNSPCVALAILARRPATTSEISRPTTHRAAMVAAVQAAGTSRCMSLKRSRTKTLQAYRLMEGAQTAHPAGASDWKNLNRDADVRHHDAHVR